MSFTSTDFIWFSIVFIPLYLITINKLVINNLVLLSANLLFYGWVHPYFVALLLASTVVDFTLALLIDSSRNKHRRRAFLAMSIVVNLIFLGYFKYTNFIISTFNDSVGSNINLIATIVLPAGISFYTFQSMSYTIEVYREHIRATRSLLDYLEFVSFFPHLVAGPIMRATVLLPQIQKQRTFDPELAEDGARQILWGLPRRYLSRIISQLQSRSPFLHQVNIVPHRCWPPVFSFPFKYMLISPPTPILQSVLLK